MAETGEGEIAHDLAGHFEALREFHSTRELRNSALYKRLDAEITRVLETFDAGSFASETPGPEPYYRAVAWNIERGIRFGDILWYLQNEPVLSGADLLLITEADLGMARSGNRHVARDLARELGMNYLFAPSYINLAKGCGVEHEFEGENTLAIHGNAILSRYPLSRPASVPLPNGHDKMRGREKRLGCQRAILGSVRFPEKSLRAASVHLDVRARQRDRRRQLEAVIKRLRPEEGPCLIGGDWNTSTYDSHSAASAIVGFWIRVLMGTHNMIRNHYPYPERLFERRLFRMLEQAGFDYRACNALGIGTTHYSVEDIKQYKNLREWIPEWCFRFIEWSLKEHDGCCSFKLDWFAQRGLKILGPGEKASPRKGPSLAPRVIGNLQRNGVPASDHDAIVVDFVI